MLLQMPESFLPSWLLFVHCIVQLGSLVVHLSVFPYLPDGCKYIATLVTLHSGALFSLHRSLCILYIVVQIHRQAGTRQLKKYY